MIQKDQNPEKCGEGQTQQSYICILKQKLLMMTQMITVEPLVFLYQMAKTIVKPALDNLELEKACRVNLNYNSTICDSILNGSHENYTHENNNIQEALSNMHSWQQPLQSFTPLVLVIFFGSFSDRHRLRKPFLLFPLLGDIIGLSGCILCVVYMNLWPLEVQGVIQNVVPSLLGGSVVILMYTTAYIADTTSVENRTMRLGVLQILLSLSGPLGNSFCGNFFLRVGYIGLLSTAVAVLSVALIYGLLFIKEVSKADEEPKKCLILDLFNPQHAIDTFTIIIKKKAGISRGYAVATLLMIFLHRGAFEGVIVSLLTRMFRVAKKSLATKIVSETDIAKMQSLIGIFEIIAPAISVPIYNIIYIHTLVDYPYCFFFFSIILYGTCCFLIGYMKFQEWRKMRMKNEAIPTVITAYCDGGSIECQVFPS